MLIPTRMNSQSNNVDVSSAVTLCQGYWCHIITPVFFGRSTRSRHASRAETRRIRVENFENTRACKAEMATAVPVAAAMEIAGESTRTGTFSTDAFFAIAAQVQLRLFMIVSTRYVEVSIIGLYGGHNLRGGCA